MLSALTVSLLHVSAGHAGCTWTRSERQKMFMFFLMCDYVFLHINIPPSLRWGVRGQRWQHSAPAAALGCSTLLKDTSAACRAVTQSSVSLITPHQAASERKRRCLHLKTFQFCPALKQTAHWKHWKLFTGCFPLCTDRTCTNVTRQQ